MAASKNSTVRHLSLDEVISKYARLDDEAFAAKAFNQARSYAVPHKSGQSIGEATALEYSSTFNTLIRHVGAAAGQRRESLPSLAELLLRAHGPRTIEQIIQSASALRKVAIVCIAIVSRAIPELTDADRAAAWQAWQATLRGARQRVQQQVSTTGYSGDVDAGSLPTWREIQAAINKLPAGDTFKLVMMLYCLRFRGQWATNAPLLNMGHVRVFRPAEYNQVPTKDQIAKMAQDDAKPRGWLVLSNDQAQRPDSIYLVVGEQLDRSGEVRAIVEHFKLTADVRKEVRAYLQNRPAQQHFLITHAKVTVNQATAQPYAGVEGRASFLAWTNRKLFATLGCRLRQLRVSVALHYKEQDSADLADGSD